MAARWRFWRRVNRGFELNTDSRTASCRADAVVVESSPDDAMAAPTAIRPATAAARIPVIVVLEFIDQPFSRRCGQ
jgi:hypothetical protein